VTKQRWALVAVVLGVALVIPGMIVFARTDGGVTPALLTGLILLLVGGLVRGRGPIEQGTLPAPPRPDSSHSSEQNEL
jgi:hypothetical protein